jgi:nucleotide-binding universal stress UspA family protein
VLSSGLRVGNQRRTEEVMFARILVPTDFSPSCAAALDYARVLAARFGATLHLLHVLENDFLRPMIPDPETVEAATLRQLRELLTADERERGAVCDVLRSDAVADEIVSYARSHKIDLVVIGVHDRSALAHLVKGRVAERVVRTADCMVLTSPEVTSSAA